MSSIKIHDYSNSLCDLFHYHQNFRTSFLILEKLGKGGFGNVYKVKCLKDKNIYAIKEIKIKKKIFDK